MNIITIKNGNLISPINGYKNIKKDILIKNGKIQKIDDYIEPQGEIINAENLIVTPGFIDIHTHCYPKSFIGMQPDIIGIEQGVSTIIDAGSSGTDNYEDFKQNYIDKSKTKVFTLINYSKEGLIKGNELTDFNKIDENKLEEFINKYSDNIIGIKARASSSVVGNLGFEPIKNAINFAHKVNKPILLHVGNYPPSIKDVLNIVNENDIITHAFHGKNGGIIENNKIIEEAILAKKRGVKFDIGHGEASFSFKTFKKAIEQNFNCDIISTDIHSQNYNGPVYSLLSVMNKILNCDDNIFDIISKCSSIPAKHFNLNGIGELKEGYFADINILKLENCNEIIEDSIGDTINLTKKLVLINSIYSIGNRSEIFRRNF